MYSARSIPYWGLRTNCCLPCKCIPFLQFDEKSWPSSSQLRTHLLAVLPISWIVCWIKQFQSSASNKVDKTTLFTQLQERNQLITWLNVKFMHVDMTSVGRIFTRWYTISFSLSWNSSCYYSLLCNHRILHPTFSTKTDFMAMATWSNSKISSLQVGL